MNNQPRLLLGANLPDTSNNRKILTLTFFKIFLIFNKRIIIFVNIFLLFAIFLINYREFDLTIIKIYLHIFFKTNIFETTNTKQIFFYHNTKTIEKTAAFIKKYNKNIVIVNFDNKTNIIFKTTKYDNLKI